ncbi:glycoside hydrolase family 16 protein [Lophiostoma macrostomum CBS 122681]|uniref:Glycoside hydrolase family 16 protein n=1 Tax=Lophiostoma macrostomum CBS 122681 TaxID=1314788 RepID=A0A6A6T0X0_9PLEO|nr:glycoside hydrolase family 16 protein [Lophiostoma macrostomum CBS 122681]
MPPSHEGFTLLWSSDFQGPPGSLPDAKQWDVVQRGPNWGNKEVQSFVAGDKRVVRVEGQGLVIGPFHTGSDPTTNWLSARLHGRQSFHAEPGHVMRIEARLKVGAAPKEKQAGIWPSFWLLGDSYRNGGDSTWPMCGEIDIFENATGESFSIPAVHFGASSETRQMRGGGQHRVNFDRSTYHTWTLLIDRKSSSDWRNEKLQFLLDETKYFEVSGRDVGDEARWASVAHQGIFPILQVAVGTNWDGGSQPNAQTGVGEEVGLAVGYVGVYSA